MGELDSAKYRPHSDCPDQPDGHCHSGGPGTGRPVSGRDRRVGSGTAQRQSLDSLFPQAGTGHPAAGPRGLPGGLAKDPACHGLDPER